MFLGWQFIEDVHHILFKLRIIVCETFIDSLSFFYSSFYNVYLPKFIFWGQITRLTGRKTQVARSCTCAHKKRLNKKTCCVLNTIPQEVFFHHSSRFKIVFEIVFSHEKLISFHSLLFFFHIVDNRVISFQQFSYDFPLSTEADKPLHIKLMMTFTGRKYRMRHHFSRLPVIFLHSQRVLLFFPTRK